MDDKSVSQSCLSSRKVSYPFLSGRTATNPVQPLPSPVAVGRRLNKPSSAGIRARVVDRAHEHVEQLVSLCRIEADSVIVHGHHRRPALAACADFRLPTLALVLRCVVEQVRNDLADSLGVALGLGTPRDAGSNPIEEVRQISVALALGASTAAASHFIGSAWTSTHSAITAHSGGASKIGLQRRPH